MAWQDKYYYTFKDINQVNYIVHIMHNVTGTTTATEIRGDHTPFTINFPQFERFAPVRGSGCAMNLLSETDRQHLNLYTSDMFGYQIKVELKNRFKINSVYSNASTPPDLPVGVNYYIESGNVVIYDDGSLAAIYNTGDIFPYAIDTTNLPYLFTMDFNSAILTTGTIFNVNGTYDNTSVPPPLEVGEVYTVESGEIVILDDGSLAARYIAGDSFDYAQDTTQLPALFTMVFTDAVLTLPAKTIWHGYMDSELYTEPFNDTENYTVSLSGSDGMAMLERILYLDTLGNHYTGITTQWDAISAILLKLGIPWNNMYVKLSTTTPEVTFAAGETILHKSWMRNQNWYDEDGQPFTCRKVLEETLRPYGAFLMIANNDVYITDFNTVLLGTSAYNHYNGTTLAYIGTKNVDMFIGDISDIGFASASQTFEIMSGKNRQVVRYSPYRKIRLLDFNAANDNFREDGTYGTTTFGTAPYGWQETWYTESNTWNRYSYGEFVFMEGLDDNDGEQDSYLKILPTGYQANFDTTYFKMKTDPDFVISGKLLPHHPRTSPHPEYMYFLKVNAKAYVRFLENMNDTDHPAEAGCYTLVLNTRMQIGQQKAVSHGVYAHLWHPMSDPIEMRLYFTIGVKDGKSFTNFFPIDDKWVDLNDAIAYRFTIADVDIPLWGMTGGTFNYEIMGWEVWGSGGENDPNNEIIYDQVKDIRLKDIALTIVDEHGVELTMADTEYTAYMNPQFKDEGDVITTYLGENIKDYPTERGALMATTGNTFFNLHSWTKEGATDNIESLLLRSIQTNYQYPTYQLSMTTNQIRRIIGYVTYDHYLQQIFQITGAEHNLEDATTQLTISETYSDDLTINPLNY